MLDIIIVVIKLNPMKVGIFVCFGYWSALEQCLALNRCSVNILGVNKYHHYNQLELFCNADIIYFDQQRAASSYDLQSFWTRGF